MGLNSKTGTGRAPTNRSQQIERMTNRNSLSGHIRIKLQSQLIPTYMKLVF